MGQTKYATSGDVNIAYQVLGDGPVDLVYVTGFVSHVELFQEEPHIARHIRRLASLSRLVLFDKRGTGMSDPWHAPPTLDERMDDIRAVMDAAGVERAALFGVSEGGPLSIVFTATHPERVTALALYATGARFTRADDYPHGLTPEQIAPFLDAVESGWGTPSRESLAVAAPSMVDNHQFVEDWGRARRRAATPKMAADLLRMNSRIDVRSTLPAITVPTLVLHRRGDRFVNVEHGRYLAEHDAGARYVEFEGDDHMPWIGDEELFDEVEEFLTGARTAGDADRALATVLFTDIVGSTQRAAAEGDRRWRELLDAHDRTTRREVGRFGGRAVKSTRDGFLATFDRPGRGIEAARAVVTAVRQVGLEIWVGVHIGEVEVRHDDIGGMAVHIGARVASLADPGEVLVSRTVKDLVVGTGLAFSERGTHQLKGVPGSWQLFAVA